MADKNFLTDIIDADLAEGAAREASSAVKVDVAEIAVKENTSDRPVPMHQPTGHAIQMPVLPRAVLLSTMAVSYTHLNVSAMA